jgi:hypothetical protein
MTEAESIPRVQLAKKSMWQSVFENPKVLAIAFFAMLGNIEGERISKR